MKKHAKMVNRVINILDQIQTFQARGLTPGSAPVIVETPQFTAVTAKTSIGTITQSAFKASADSDTYFQIPSAEVFGNSFNENSSIVLKVMLRLYVILANYAIERYGCCGTIIFSD